jgi:hypothetical protein
MSTLAEYDAKGIAARGVGRFLAEHEDCAEGFQIARESGGARGALQLVCSGCGQRTGYGGAAPELLASHGIDAGEAAGGGRFRPSRESMERWLPAPAALPWWIPNAYILLVIAVGLGMIAFGVLHDRPGDRATLPGQAPSQTPTTVTPPLAGGNAASAVPAPAPRPEPAKPQNRPARSDLHRVEVLDRFAVGIPSGWSSGMAGGGIAFVAPGDDAEVRVFLQPGESPPVSHTGQTADFLRSQHSGAKVGHARRVRIGGERALELVSRYPGGRETAAVLSADGYTFLITSQVERSASASLKADSRRVMKSFRPS